MEHKREMKVGGYNIMNRPPFQRVVRSTFVGKWRQDLKVMAIVVVKGEEFMTMVNGR